MGRIILRDWPSAGLVVFAAICLSLIAAATVYGWLWSDAEGLRFALYFGVFIVAPICLVWGWIAVRRVRLIAGLLANGPRVRGRIDSLGENSEGIGHAVVTYDYEGRPFRSIITTESFAPEFSPQPGDDVELIIDPRRPQRAFFVNMFAQSRNANEP